MDKIRVIIPTLERPGWEASKDSLKHLPFDYDLKVITGRMTWPEAINKGLEGHDSDVLIMDDDAALTAETFDNFGRYYPHGDIFGFKLLKEDGSLQHGGGVMTARTSIIHLPEGENVALYCCHVTASVMYIKKQVLKKLGGITEDWPSYQFEDVDFNWRALEEGFRIMYIPNVAYHGESLTKRDLDDFEMGSNAEKLSDRFLKDNTFVNYLNSFPRKVFFS